MNKEKMNLGSGWKTLFSKLRSESLLIYYKPIANQEETRLRVTPPMKVVVLRVSKWDGWLVGYFTEQKLPFSFVKDYVKANVKSLGKVNVLSLGQGCFMLNMRMNI